MTLPKTQWSRAIAHRKYVEQVLKLKLDFGVMELTTARPQFPQETVYVRQGTGGGDISRCIKPKQLSEI
jgi:hypothetical protein